MNNIHKERSESLTSVENTELNKYFSDNVFLTDLWHCNDFFTAPEDDNMKCAWRSKERMKTTGVALVLCLNIGTDPPGIVKPFPCARKECWLDPFAHPKSKSLENIGNALQAQYEKWQPKAKFKHCLDPSPDDLRRVCVNLRKAAKNDRLLLHYNGHGVPAPTKNGELWVFYKNYSHYMPVNASELKAAVGDPAIYVLDCSGAGKLIPHLAEVALEPPILSESSNNRYNTSGSGSMESFTMNNLNSVTEDHSTIILASCRSDEILPLQPQYPADIFTACLTTPISMAIRWLIIQVLTYITVLIHILIHKNFLYVFFVFY
jgi:regulator-associated protein of mTOR